MISDDEILETRYDLMIGYTGPDAGGILPSGEGVLKLETRVKFHFIQFI